MSRANPFSDLSDFEAQPVSRKVPVAQIEEIAEASGFPSRKASAPKPVVVEPSPPPARSARRYTTGRNRRPVPCDATVRPSRGFSCEPTLIRRGRT